MTDNEIIKGLECCNDGWNCESCAFDDEDESMSECTSKLAKAALDLIKRQQERIERLKDNLDAVLKEKADHTEAIEKFANRIVEQLEKLRQEYPYKVVGEYDTYSTYNEAWSYCSDRAIAIVKGVQNE